MRLLWQRWMVYEVHMGPIPVDSSKAPAVFVWHVTTEAETHEHGELTPASPYGSSEGLSKHPCNRQNNSC